MINDYDKLTLTKIGQITESMQDLYKPPATCRQYQKLQLNFGYRTPNGSKCAPSIFKSEDIEKNHPNIWENVAERQLANQTVVASSPTSIMRTNEDLCFKEEVDRPFQHFQDMAPDTKVPDGRKDGRTDNAKIISPAYDGG
ncbi:hypothetical protein DPMN_178560 [Dreissena polymorpha]|uniref:Uncharacterized protein n=1 Tax=Dreissena polymorpha TaxID=45954 RepID=A0A9D4IMQ6_DREPO|nr:hypothetical protein DPMN_178560 [Dreissena polymorpha]